MGVLRPRISMSCAEVCSPVKAVRETIASALMPDVCVSSVRSVT
jgi:hypothetical protein